MYLKSVLLATTAALLMSTSLISAQRGFLGGMTDEGYRPMDFSNDVYMGPGSKRHTRITKVKHRRHVSSDKQDAEPFVSGSEPGWGKNLSSEQRRMAGFDDARVARKNSREPAVATRGVPGYVFNVLTFRNGIHGRGENGGGASSGAVRGAGGGGGNNQSGHNPPAAPPFAISQIKSEPFGVFATLQECDMARAAKIADLDAADQRFPHQQANAPKQVITLPNGTVIEAQTPRDERKDVTFCEPGVYAPGQVSPNIAKNPDFPLVPAAMRVAQDVTLEVQPGFVKQWIAPRPFSRVIPGTSDVVEVLSAIDRELVFMVKPDIALPPTTNILLVNDVGEVIANLHIVIPGSLNTEVQQGPNGYQVYRKDNPNYVPPKEKK
jgi:hypothetical protein